MFEDVDEDLDQELGQLSLGTSTLSLFCGYCKLLVLQCKVFFIRKDRDVLGGFSWYDIFNFRLNYQ